MKKLVLFFALIYSTIVFPQTNETQAIIAPQGFGINLLNSKGNSSIDNDISNIGFINPAAISNFNFNFGAGLSYQFSSEIEEGWIADTGTTRKNDWMPQSTGAVFKLDDFFLWLGFGQKYNAKLLFDPIPITTTTNPDGTGEYITVEYKTRVQSYSLSASYSFPEVFDENSSLEIGFRYSYNHLKFYEDFWEMTIDESDNIGSYAVGLQYSNQIWNNRMLRIGFSYEIEPDF